MTILYMYPNTQRERVSFETEYENTTVIMNSYPD